MAEPCIWTAEERAWAQECFRSGDGVADIADASERNFLDVALALGVYGHVDRERRWKTSARPGGYIAPRWVGGMLCEVAIYRCRHGEEPIALAVIAQVSASRMYRLCKGLVKRRRRLPADVARIAA